jgi:hypothetical protein
VINHEILDNGPEGWEHVDEEGDYIDENGFFMGSANYASEPRVVGVIRSRADIERIVELEKLLSTATGFNGNVTVKSDATFPSSLTVKPIKTNHASYMDSFRNFGPVNKRSKDETKN